MAAAEAAVVDLEAAAVAAALVAEAAAAVSAEDLVAVTDPRLEDLILADRGTEDPAVMATVMAEAAVSADFCP